PVRSAGRRGHGDVARERDRYRRGAGQQLLPAGGSRRQAAHPLRLPQTPPDAGRGGRAAEAASGVPRMVVKRWTGPPADTHTYLVADPASREAWSIDAPLETAAPLLEHVRRENLSLTRLILTHGHFDHILDVPRYK